MKKKEQKLSTYKGEKADYFGFESRENQKNPKNPKKSQKISRNPKKPENPKSKVVFSNIFRSYSQVFRT